MVKDPVYRMGVDEKRSKWKSEYLGHPYYFCAPSCRRDFDKSLRNTLVRRHKEANPISQFCLVSRWTPSLKAKSPACLMRQWAILRRPLRPVQLYVFGKPSRSFRLP